MVIIIGAGLTGLLTAYRLKKEGIPFKIIEARSRIGGRIHTVSQTNDTAVEMGATWFSAQHQELMRLLAELELDYFQQFMEGTVFFQPFSTSPAQAIQIPSQAPSYRISGGSFQLIEALYRQLNKDHILLNQMVKEIKFHHDTVQVIANETFEANQVVLAIPPKLWAKKIVFEPALPDHVMQIAAQTHTWMEDSIKVALTYPEPFWEQEKLSGTVFSNTGPITELYDHCNHERSTYALCGFINSSYKTLKAVDRRAAVMSQLKTVFGAKATRWIDYEECIWSQEQHTFETSEIPLYPHQNNGNPVFSESYFNTRLLISSSETATEFAGYMNGAVAAAHKTAHKIILTR
tara:strand:+ start:77511 stop:78554 length:1044 start_codon:yes stop_codon:yes gene_type:complete